MRVAARAAGALLLVAVAAVGVGQVPAGPGDAPAGGSLLQEVAGAMDAPGARAYAHAAGAQLPGIAAALAPILAALPRSKEGRLEPPAVRYALHHFFVRQYGWRLTGLDPLGEAWNSSSLSGVAVLRRMPADVRAAVVRRLEGRGLKDWDVAVLGATFKYLIQDESTDSLRAAYRMLGLPLNESTRTEAAELAINLHMASHTTEQDLRTTPRQKMLNIFKNMQSVSPSWKETQHFVHEVCASQQQPAAVNATTPAGVAFDDAALMLQAVSERYGQWQNRECHDLKKLLMPLADQGTGRVPLADFYKASLDGKWYFSESVAYLRQLGALDESAPSRPQVIVPNYVAGYSNCVASTDYNDVCCISECEALLAQLEQRLAAPAVPPEAVLRAVEATPSATVPAGRSVGVVLRQRLRAIAAARGGLVPVSGRLFAQWLHHAYPLECPYPHVAGTTRPQTHRDFGEAAAAEATASEAEMRSVAGQAWQTGGPRQTVPWDSREELLGSEAVEGSPLGFVALHLSAAAAATATLLLGLLRSALRGCAWLRRWACGARGQKVAPGMQLEV